MYTILVCPAEIINFVRVVALTHSHLTPSYNLAVSIVNLLQATNFAFNFLLYCSVNVQFRRTFKDIFCSRVTSEIDNKSGGVMTNYGSVVAAMSHQGQHGGTTKCDCTHL